MSVQKRIYLTTAKKSAIVEEKVATDKGSMTNRIMSPEVMVAEEQDMAGNNMDCHKSRDEIMRLVSNDNTGVLESEQKAQALRERRNRESIAELIKHQSIPEVDSEASNREVLKRRALEERRMRERDRRNLAGVSLMQGRHPQHRVNEKKAKVGEERAKDITTSNSDSKAHLRSSFRDPHDGTPPMLAPHTHRAFTTGVLCLALYLY